MLLVFDYRREVIFHNSSPGPADFDDLRVFSLAM